jgi:leucine dehydrogenase
MRESISKPMDTVSQIFDQFQNMGHKEIVFCNDPATGLKAIIAIHDTTLGPALGGTRFYNYTNEQEALQDVLRLSKGMTYKAAISGLNLGGGKAVIIGDPSQIKSEALVRRFGKFVNTLSGNYITAKDVGTLTQDMVYISMETKHVVGLPQSMGGGGDPSPLTAYGVYMGMKACAREVYGTDNLAGKKVAVQGAGAVGEHLIKYLRNENATIFVTDINRERLGHVSAHYEAKVIDGKGFYDLDMDIYAPCALGATINDDTIKKLKCQIIAGAANNQLADEVKHGKAVVDSGILYAPDFLINAGGLINSYAELVGYNNQRAMQATEMIYQVTQSIIEKSKNENITTTSAANKIAEERIEAAKGLRAY